MYNNIVSERFCYDYHLKLHLVVLKEGVFKRRVKTKVLIAVTKILFAFVIDLKHVSVPLITPSSFFESITDFARNLVQYNFVPQHRRQ